MNNMTTELKQSIADLRIKPSSETLTAVIQQPEFRILLANLLHTTGTQSKMIVEYMHDVSAMLCLISSVREHSIERHLAAERALIPKCFAFGHPNYSHYLTYQHDRLLDIKATESMVWDDLVKNGFGGSLSGEPFSTIHGDLITETTINREVKVRGGPMQGGFSTDVKTVDTFLKTSHIVADLRGKLKERLNVLSTSSHKETTKGAKKKHEEMINSLVGQLNNYFDPFLVGPARNFKTGTEIDPAIVDGLLSSTDLGNEMYAEFVNERLRAQDDEKVSFFQSVKNPKLKTGLEKPKKALKVISVLKEDRQAFGSMVGKDTSPEEALSFPLTCVPLALASPDGDLRQGSKASLRNHLIEESDALTNEPADRAIWLVDGMAAVRSLPHKETWKEYAASFIMFCTPSRDSHPAKLGIIFDCYTRSHIKQLTQLRRGTPGKRVYISSSQQSMPSGKAWQTFLHHPENKTELIHFLVKFMKENRNLLRIPTIVTENEKSWLLTTTAVIQLDDCNHIEADTRLIYVASTADSPVVIRATDTDVLILMVFVYTEMRKHQWQMKIDKDSYVNIGKICDGFGTDVCKALPAFHSITGCDTVSFPFRVGKIKPLKKMIKVGATDQISTFGCDTLTDEQMVSAKEFFRSIMYPGLKNENLTETRVRMYRNQKEKASERIIPDDSSVEQHLKRSWLQSFIWRQCLERQIAYPEIDESGWKEEDGTTIPVWYTCSQFPPDMKDLEDNESVNGKPQFCSYF